MRTFDSGAGLWSKSWARPVHGAEGGYVVRFAVDGVAAVVVSPGQIRDGHRGQASAHDALDLDKLRLKIQHSLLQFGDGRLRLARCGQLLWRRVGGFCIGPAVIVYGAHGCASSSDRRRLPR